MKAYLGCMDAVSRMWLPTAEERADAESRARLAAEARAEAAEAELAELRAAFERLQTSE